MRQVQCLSGAPCLLHTVFAGLFIQTDQLQVSRTSDREYNLILVHSYSGATALFRSTSLEFRASSVGDYFGGERCRCSRFWPPKLLFQQKEIKQMWLDFTPEVELSQKWMRCAPTFGCRKSIENNSRLRPQLVHQSP